MAAGGSGKENVADFIQFLENEHRAYPNAHEELLDIFTDGSRVTARHLFTGTQLGPLGTYPPTGADVRSVYIALYTVEGGQITESWAEWDNLTDLKQLGHVPRSA